MSTIEEFEVFFKAHYTNALCLAISIVHDEDVGRDIVSEAFEYLLTHPKSLSESELNNYLFVIVRNVLGTNAPQLKGGNNIYLDPWPRYAKGDMIWYCTQEGSYSINPTKLTAMNNVVESEFIEEPYEADEQIVALPMGHRSLRWLPSWAFPTTILWLQVSILPCSTIRTTNSSRSRQAWIWWL